MSNPLSFYRLNGEDDAAFCARIRRVARLFKRKILKAGTDDPSETHYTVRLSIINTPNGERYDYEQDAPN